jgi:hypothetical protein
MIPGHPIIDTLANRLVSTAKRLSGLAQPYRRVLAVAAAVVFLAGLSWSFSALDLGPSQISAGPLLLLILLLGPVGVDYGAIGLMLLGLSADARMSFVSAFRSDAYAQLAEALPVPGGAIVRAGALMNSGVRVSEGTILVLASAILWISLASLAGGLVLLPSAALAGAFLACLGSIFSVTVLIWLTRQAGWQLAMWTLLHRFTGLLINAARLKCAFATLSVALPFVRTLPFALATIVGSASSIAPAGLGVSEGLSALIAGSLSVAAPAAFVAAALNRLSALLSTGLIVLILEMRGLGRNREKLNEQRRTA